MDQIRNVKLGFHSVCILGALILSACTTIANTGVVPIGNGLYMLSKQTSGLNWSGGVIKAEIFQEAIQYCTNQGKKFSLVSDTSQDATMYSFASAEVRFLCK